MERDGRLNQRKSSPERDEDNWLPAVLGVGLGVAALAGAAFGISKFLDQKKVEKTEHVPNRVQVGATHRFYSDNVIKNPPPTFNLERCLESFHCKDICIVSEGEDWNYIADRFIREANEVGVVGFDCEWVNNYTRRPVALLQLATHKGMCVLIQLSQLEGFIPERLKNFLKNEKILKVGVDCMNDQKYLLEDYNIQVNGCLDLRHIVLKEQATNGENFCCDGLSLAALSKKYLKIELNKEWKLSNWEEVNLNNDQIQYAANDALVGVHILLVLLKILKKDDSGRFMTNVRIYVNEICSLFADVQFIIPKKKNYQNFASIY